MGDPAPTELEFADEVAAFFEQEGMPLIAGRVIGWLLVCDPPEQTPAQLAEALQVSRSSISSAVRLLTPSGLVRRTRRPGRRDQYLSIPPDGWSRMLAARYAKTAAFRRVAERGLAALPDSPPERRERLANVHRLYLFLEDELPALWRRWEQAADTPEGTGAKGFDAAASGAGDRT
ncbi:GbsR/MarR family transcriptional regulator [Streptomonospora nanhaiensis]|uniref:DNA-binding MarR family transcriptional regulator n=1 Tax=Streptomonospora nanhaiensis TaxID=1323731 RepID=A0A853BKX7_9ACTN|nr:MarR family transcriptional regulator [Streptomonospora nanhaiensis]MBV2364225.1 MarR family transcriptional regulator [Streptomonospora nanhaiensis]MBX9386655.1 MarR family transcriptional regulator [Streptomonospora nanhaiensis]NYI95182.1 DNA-binding MarR family transcriptional regulator [Streptomonospora nanhaiensis]